MERGREKPEPGKTATLKTNLSRVKSMRLSCSHRVLLCRLAEWKASALVWNALHDIRINFMAP